MRKRVVLAMFAVAWTGAIVAVGGVLVSRWWVTRHTTDGVDFGWYAYSGPRRFVDYLPSSPPAVDWASLLVPAAVAGAALGVLLLGGGLLLRRWFSKSPAEPGPRVHLVDQE